jgi:hypothetical protein
MLNDLATWAKTKAQEPQNDCYYDCTNDDGPACTPNPGSATQYVRFTGTASKDLGSTVTGRKVCYIEFPFNYDGTTGPVNAAGDMGPVVGGDPDSTSFVAIDGNTRGAGILVVKGELVIEDTFTYDGIVIVLGPTGTLELEDNVTIRGAAFVGSTEGYCDSGPSCSTSNLRFHHTQFKPFGSGSVRYDAAQVQTAQQLLATWTPPGGGGGGAGSDVEIKAWHACDPSNPASCPP